MSKKMSSNTEIVCQLSDSKWNDAILVAEEELRILAMQTRRIQQAIRIFQVNKRDGVQSPKADIQQQDSQ